MEALESESACGTFTFRGEDYRVSVEVIPSSEDPEQELLLVDVEDKSTAEQWRGEFQPSCKYSSLERHVCGDMRSVSPLCCRYQGANTKDREF